MPKTLTMTFLGEMSIVIDGHPLSALPTRKDQALFIYLACLDKPQNRGHLAEMFWPDRTQKRASSNLRTALARIRRHLKAYLLVTRQTIAFNPHSPHQIDVHDFEAQLSSTLTYNQADSEYGQSFCLHSSGVRFRKFPGPARVFLLKNTRG